MIFLEDCLITLKDRNLSYNYIITSPPDFAEIGYDTDNLDKYKDFLRERFQYFNPINNLVTIFVSDRKAESTIIQKHLMICDIMKEFGWMIHSQKIWVKHFDKDLYRHGYTFILTFRRDKIKNNILEDVFYEKFKPASLTYTYNFSKTIVKKFIETFTEPNQAVFDPFMGSGTTAIVCIETDRNYYGCEIDTPTYELAKTEISKTVSSKKFFY